jgi:hypothetical protein
MTTKDRTRDQLDTSFDDDALCGPSLLSVLDGIRADHSTDCWVFRYRRSSRSGNIR